LCKFIEYHSKDSELRGKALTYLGLIYHFGEENKVQPFYSSPFYHEEIFEQSDKFSHLGEDFKPDLQMAQKFY
jgi:hypothetical protein